MEYEIEMGTRKVVELKYIIDADVEEMTHCLSKLSNKDTGDGKSRSRKTRLNLSLKNKIVEEDGQEEYHKLMEEKLPEKYMQPATNVLSEVLLEEKEENQFGFQTPKKKRGMALKAEESATKYYGTPNKCETPSNSRLGKNDDSDGVLTTTTNNKSKSAVRTRRSSISFGGEIGATPTKGNIFQGTPPKSALKNSRRSIMVDTTTPSSKLTKVNGHGTPAKSSKRAILNDDQVSRTPSRRQSMAPKMAPIQEVAASYPKTPRNIRLRTKECLSKAIHSSLCEDDSESEEDYSSDDEDEYKPKGDEESSEEESDIDDRGTSETDEEKISPLNSKKRTLTLVVKKDQPSVTPSRSRRKEVNYEFATDAYFETFASKDITSNNTLSRLRNPRLREDTLRDLLKGTDVDHKEPLSKLSQEYRCLFDRWLFTLREGFNILLFGLGSKRHILQDLHDGVLSDSQVLVVNGFFPGLTIKEILDTILTGLLGAKDAPANPLEAVELIEKIQSSRYADTLYLLIHNLDGPSLRNNKAQTVLSKLAKITNVRLVASIDHINAPLMWDQTKLYRYNFSWWDVTTLMPYSAETSFESSLLIQRSGALQLSSLHSVFKSLTKNAKKIYLMIARHQLQNASNHAYTGLPFQELYWSARDAFVVSTQMALRTQLTEFLDHHMVKMKRGGEELLIIPIDNAIIQQFVQSQEEKQD